jgi:hypothetical protein
LSQTTTPEIQSPHGPGVFVRRRQQGRPAGGPERGPAGVKEIATRFDFRGSKSKIEWNEKELALTLTSDDEGKLKS